MFVLKILVILSAILNSSVSSTQCRSDEVVEFICQEPSCSTTIDSGLSVARLRTNSKEPISIVGYNKDNFLIKKNKNAFYVVGKRNVQTNIIKFKVNIHRTTLEICNSTNNNIKNNHYESSFNQTNINTDKTFGGKRNDTDGFSVVVINDACKKSKQNNENSCNGIDTNVQNGVSGKDNVDVVKIEYNDNVDNSYSKNIATKDINIENLVKNVSVITDQITNLKLIDSEKTNLNYTLKHISPQPLGNYSSTDCTLDLCTNNSNTLQQKSNDLQKNKIRSEFDNILPNTSIINKIEKQPLYSYDTNEFKGNLSESQTPHQNNLFDVEFATLLLNYESVNDNTTYSVLLQNLTEMIPNDCQKICYKVNITELLNKKIIDQSISENRCRNPFDMDNSLKNGYENIEHQLNTKYKVHIYENVLKRLQFDVNEKLKKFKPRGLISSINHLDTCGEISCLTFKRDVNESIGSLQPKSKPKDQDQKSQKVNIYFKEDNTNIFNEITEPSDTELYFLDHFHKCFFSLTLNFLDFLLYIFGKGFDECNDLHTITDQPIVNKNIFEHIEYKNLSGSYFIVAVVIILLFTLISYKIKTTERNFKIKTLNKQLTEAEHIISQATNIQFEKLEQEVEELTEISMKTHKLLSSRLESSVESTEELNILKEKLINSENLVADLTQKDFDKCRELERKNSFIKTIQSTVDKLTHKNNRLVKDKVEISLQLEQVLIKNTLKESRLQSEVNNLKFELDKQTNALLTTKNEVSLSKNILQEVMTKKFNLTAFEKCMSSIKLSAELEAAKQMCDSYKHKLNESSKSKQQYLDHIDNLKISIVNLKKIISKLEKKNQGSLHKLNELTPFFIKHKGEYLKQIKEKVLLCNDKEGESNDFIKHLKPLNQEIANYRYEIQSLKEEVTDQEASFKIQIYAADKKVSDTWMLFRQAEKKFKEIERETVQLRNKIITGDKILEKVSESIDSSKDFEDKVLDIPFPNVYPDFTLLSLIDFEPPPPILIKES